MAVNLTIENIDGQDVYQGFTLVGKVKIENDTASTINVTGIQLVASVTNPSAEAGASPEQIVLGTIDPTIYGNAETGSVAGVIAAGATGSFDITILANSNLLGGNESQSYTLDAIAILNADPNQLVYANPQASFQVRGADFQSAEIASPILVWSLWDNGSPLLPISNQNFDFQVQTNMVLNPDGAVNPAGRLYNTIPPLSSLNNYTSSNPAVATVVRTSNTFYGATAPLMTLTNSVGSVLQGQETQLSGGAGAVRVLSAGTTTISNEIADGITGSFILTVVDALPVSIQITPNFVNLAPAGTQQLTAKLVKSNGQTTDISSTGVWSTGNSAVATVSSAGLVTANSSVQQGATAITVAYGNIVASVPVNVTARTYGLPTA